MSLDIAAVAWTPRPAYRTELMAAPGQRWPAERYLQRFAQVNADIDAGFTGITADGRVAPELFTLEETGVSTRPIREAATELLDALSAEQRARTLFGIDAPEWQLWHGLFTRQLRHGMPVEEMTAIQREWLQTLLRVSLSAKGYAAVQDIRKTNRLAAELTGLFVDLGEDVYWLSIMGRPAADQPWGWQLDGHHVNINCFVVGDQGVSAHDFSAEQRRLLEKLLSAYVGYLRPGHAGVRLREVGRYLDQTYFAWIGGLDDVQPFYYRLHSPVILIEFSHIFGVAMSGDAPSRAHVQTVVRTPNGNDYGKDLLRQHIEQYHSKGAGHSSGRSSW